MSEPGGTARWIAADKAHSWHPFTRMDLWCAPEHQPLMLTAGTGALLRDSLGREFIDGNSSIWTNLHGHRHPRIDAALHAQIDRVAHTSFLGFSHPLASELAAALVAFWPPATLSRVFFSDDGSTAIEVALKMGIQYFQLQSGGNSGGRDRFVAFDRAYHGDTMGASSLGGIGAFHGRFAGWQFPAVHVGGMEELEALPEPQRVAAVVIEPLVQGAAGIRLWPPGMLAHLRDWCDRHGAFLIADEVLTGFGRTGTMFACQQENVVPDFLALAKGLTGGYLPMAATLTTEKVFAAFQGGADRTLYYGHSYTASQLGCAAALASLDVFREEKVLEALAPKIALLRGLLVPVAELETVYEVRQCGFICGIELRHPDARPFDPGLRLGEQVCLAARAFGLLTRPIRDVIVFIPPFCITESQLRSAVSALSSAIAGVCGNLPER